MKEDIRGKCKEIALRTGIDPQKYVSPEVTLKIANLMTFQQTFISTLIKPVIGLNVIFIIASVFLGMHYGSVLFGILFFVFSISISFLSGGLYGFKTFLETTVKDINDIVQYSLNIVNRITSDIESLKVKASSYTISDILRLVMYGITMPQLEVAVNTKVPVLKTQVYGFAEKVLYNVTETLAEKIEKGGSSKSRPLKNIGEQVNKNASQPLNTDEKISDTAVILKPIADMTDQVTKAALYRVTPLINIALLISVSIGVIPLGLLIFLYRS